MYSLQDGSRIGVCGTIFLTTMNDHCEPRCQANNVGYISRKRPQLLRRGSMIFAAHIHLEVSNDTHLPDGLPQFPSKKNA